MKHFLLAVALFATLLVTANAQDLSAVSPSGQTLYYNIVDGHAELVHPGGWPIPQNYVTGELVIPSYVEYNGQTYIVTTLSYNGWINRGTFENCSGLTSVSIPNTVTNIGGGAFRYCTGLINVELSNTIDYLGDECFDHCSSLPEITIPSSASYFGDNCFCACTSLVSIYVCSQFLNSFSNLSFSVGNYGNSNCTAYIPCWFEPFLSMMANSWTSTVLWNPFDVVMNANNDSWGYSINNCNSIEAFANEGCYFIAWSDGDTSNPRDIYLTQDTSFTAIFAIDSHNVVVQVDDITHGSCDGSGRYTYGTPVTVTATSYSGFQFSHWSNGSTYNPYTFAVTSDVQLTAYFYESGAPYQDTIYIDTLVVYDTMYVHDTAFFEVHDTTLITDTVTLTEYVPVHDTIVVTLIQYDTITNTIIDTLMVMDTLWLTQTDTLWLHDTIVIHDTVYITQEGVNSVDVINAKVYSSQGQIVVEGADGKAVALFDINGRMLATKQDYGTAIRFDVPTTGTYMIKIGNNAARKVVVIR